MHPQNHSACCYWFTGLSGAGKTTLANYIYQALIRCNVPAIVLDGDQLRQGLNADLGFSRKDRRENVRRIAYVAHFLIASGYTVLVSAISPYEKDRQAARDLFEPGQFIEVYLCTDLKTCMERDPKGLYAKARAGDLEHLTGWDDPYEKPIIPEFMISTVGISVSEAAQPILEQVLCL